MGGSTKVVPVNSNTQQQVQIPQYLQDAGMAATSKAAAIADKPFTPYGGELVAPLTGSQTGAIDFANKSTTAGRDSLGLAKTALGAASGVAAGAVGTGQGALGKAANDYGTAGALANLATLNAVGNQGAGRSNMAGANSDANLADIMARYGMGAGAQPINTAADSATSLVGTANATKNAGVDSGNLDAMLARMAGGKAANSNDAGAGDLNAARSYTAASTAPITGSDLARYMNPYVSMAIDPVAAQVTKQAGQNKANIDSKAAMSGSFGGSRTGLVESQNQADLSNTLSSLYGTGYKDAFGNAQTQAGDALQRYASAAGLATSIGGQANTQANDSVSRLTQAASSAGAAGTTQSDLATAGQNRIANANQGAVAAGTAQSDRVTQALQRLIASSGNQSNLATTSSGLATDALNRLNSAGAGQIAVGNAQTNLGQAQSQLSSDDVNRLLALISPANATAGTDSSLSDSAMQRLLTAGALGQTQNQNVDNANYQQYLNEMNYPMQQLQALVSAAGGVPFGSSTDSKTQGQQIVQTPSVLGQIAGGLGAAAGAFAGSSRDAKENFGAVDDEDVLEKFRSLGVETYNYKPEAQRLIGDDGRRRIGPMSQDWAREFGGNPNMIPMPEIVGALVSAVRALDKRTATGALPLAA